MTFEPQEELAPTTNLDIFFIHLVMLVAGICHHCRRSGYRSLTRLKAGEFRETRLGTFTRTMSLFNSSRLLNKTVLITGASSGIGAVSPLIEASQLALFLTTGPSGNGGLIREGNESV